MDDNFNRNGVSHLSLFLRTADSYLVRLRSCQACSPIQRFRLGRLRWLLCLGLHRRKNEECQTQLLCRLRTVLGRYNRHGLRKP